MRKYSENYLLGILFVSFCYYVSQIANEKDENDGMRMV